MNFALLGDDVAVLPLLAAIVDHPAHRITHAALTAEVTADLLQQSPAVRLCASWDELLVAGEIDAVVVSGSTDEVLEGARQLAAGGKSLLVIPHASQGATWVYELSLICDDTRIVLQPLFAPRVHPRLQQVRRILDEGSLGTVLHMQIAVAVHKTGPAGQSPLLTVAEVELAFLPDVDLLRSLGGEYNRVTAIHSAVAEDNLALATYTLAGDNLPEAIWSLKATRGGAEWSLAVTGEKGVLRLAGDSPLADLRMTQDEVDTSSDDSDNADTALAVGSALLEQSEAALAGQPSRPDWTDLMRAFEICDGARRSIRRRRTIDLHFESTSERSQFKTQMTAVGCSLLTLTLLAVVCVLLAGAALDPRETAEIKAEHADAIFSLADFVDGSSELTTTSLDRLDVVADRMRRASFPVMIEQSPPDDDRSLDDARRLRVIEQLETAGAADAAERTRVAEITGRGFRRMMTIARVSVFVPLGLFLLLQVLLLIARPSRDTAAD